MKKINVFDINTYSYNKLYSILAKKPKECIIEFPLESIGSANSHVDISWNYLEASYIGEMLAKVCNNVSYEEKYIEGRSYYKFVKYKINYIDANNLAKTLKHVSCGVGLDIDADSKEYDDFMDGILTYENSLHNEKIVLNMPELADKYFANYIGSYYDLDERRVIDEFKKYPERKYGFWKSPYSYIAKSNIFLSHYCWIVSQQVNLLSLLNCYGGFSNIEKLENADLIQLKDVKIIYNKHNIVQFPQDSLIFNAQRCAASIEEFNNINEVDFSYDASLKEYYLLDTGDVMVLKDNNYYYIFFNLKSYSIYEIRKVLVEVTDTRNDISNILGITSNVKCTWENIDDEYFEELCYDVLINIGKFSEVNKMGKSRSRDGGRDIVAYTPKTPGVQRKKYIYQCKLIKSKSSLTASKVTDISGVILEYGADGYGIMTSTVIDPTLYDRLNGISKNLKKDRDFWSKYELERFLARYPEIRKKYFEG